MIGYDSKIVYDEIISVIDIASTKMTDTIATNLSIKSNNKKLRYKMSCYIAPTVLLVIILLFILLLFAITSQSINNNMKVENDEFQKVRIKNRTCFYFDDIIKLEDFDLDNIKILDDGK